MNEEAPGEGEGLNKQRERWRLVPRPSGRSPKENEASMTVDNNIVIIK